MEEERKKLSKKWFISEIAQKARFTQADTAIIVDVIVDVLKDVVRNRDTFVWAGMFGMKVKTILEHAGYNAALDEPMIIPDKERVIFTPSRLWRKVLDEEET